MTLSAREILKNKGIKVKEENVEALEAQWNGLKAAKENIEMSYLREAEIGLTFIPGGKKND